MLSYCRAPINNNVMRFMLKARAVLAMTPGRKFQIGYSDGATRRYSCESGEYIIWHIY
jgi:hypothetical protein